MLINTLPGLDALPAAERHLVGALDAAARDIESVGTGALDAALERLQAACAAAKARLASGMDRFKALVADLVLSFEGTGDAVLDDLTAEARTAPPAADAVPAQVPVPAEPVAADAGVAPAEVAPAISAEEARRELAHHFEAEEGITLREPQPLEAERPDLVAALSPASPPTAPPLTPSRNGKQRARKRR